MPLLEALRIFLEIRDRIISCRNYPIKIHLHAHELGIEFFKHDIEEQLAISGILEFEVVIMIPDLHAILLADLAALVDGFAYALDAIKGAILFGKPGHAGIRLTQRFRIGHRTFPVVPDEVDTE